VAFRSGTATLRNKMPRPRLRPSPALLAFSHELRSYIAQQGIMVRSLSLEQIAGVVALQAKLWKRFARHECYTDARGKSVR
jgi:hypothetical protein